MSPLSADPRIVARLVLPVSVLPGGLPEHTRCLLDFTPSRICRIPLSLGIRTYPAYGDPASGRCSGTSWRLRCGNGAPNQVRRLHYFGESCPVQQIAHVCRAGQLLAAISWRNELRPSARVRGMLV